MIFHESFELGTFIQTAQQLALCDALIYKELTLRKKQDNFRYVFIYKNSDTLRYAIFHGTFEIGGGRGHFYMQKTMHFVLYFYMQKTMHFALRFYLQKARHFALHLYLQKKYFALRFYV